MPSQFGKTICLNRLPQAPEKQKNLTLFDPGTDFAKLADERLRSLTQAELRKLLGHEHPVMCVYPIPGRKQTAGVWCVGIEKAPELAKYFANVVYRRGDIVVAAGYDDRRGRFQVQWSAVIDPTARLR
jgi:hypothetical protein